MCDIQRGGMPFLFSLLLFATSAFADDLVVSQHGTIVENVAGDLIVRNGASVTARDIQVGGRVVVEANAKFYGYGVEVAGGFFATGAGNITLQKSTMRPSHVAGDLLIQFCNGTVRLFDAQIDGHVTLQDNAAVDVVVRGNLIGQDLEVFDNVVGRSIVVRNNVVAGSFQAQGNQPDIVDVSNAVAAESPVGSFVEIVAAGNVGNERIQLLIDQLVVREWTAQTALSTFRFRADESLLPDQIRVAFAGDIFPVPIGDTGLYVDSIEIDGTVFETEEDSVYSTGNGNPGFHLTESLTKVGYFQFGLTGIENELIVLALDSVLPDGWSSAVAREANDIRLRIYEPGGKAAFAARLGAAGVIGNFYDSYSNKDLLAGSHHGEVTDRVIQWTAWEQGQTAVFDAPSLPYWEDRFNISQAGTYDNVLHGTSAVEWDPQMGRLDVWARSDRMWKTELEPNLQGSIDSLTQTTLLDGGALLVRRVLRIGDVRLNNATIPLGNPLFEAWNPFSDRQMNAFALSLDAQGKPQNWYQDGKSIPYYPSWPIAQTRGWAIAYNRFQLSKGSAFAIVFGRDIGQVHRGDGTVTTPQRFVLNCMDFSGVFCILPALWTKGLPNGSLVDQFYIFVPSHGITANTGPMLDALANRLPPPRVYHPGAKLPGEISVIADRLATGAATPMIRTDNLGPLW